MVAGCEALFHWSTEKLGALSMAVKIRVFMAHAHMVNLFSTPS
jgi:hypothetical protein